MPIGPNENKDEIDRAIKKCLEVKFALLILYLEICFLRKS